MKTRPKVILIAAISSNRGIGYKNTLLFKDREDMHLFVENTINNTVIMGRKTFNSLINTPLHSRENIVITSKSTITHRVGKIPFSLDFKSSIREAILTSARRHPNKTIFIIGGETIYKQCIDIADEIYLSEFQETKKADAFFPELSSDWLPYEVKQYKNFIFKKYKKY